MTSAVTTAAAANSWPPNLRTRRRAWTGFNADAALDDDDDDDDDDEKMSFGRLAACSNGCMCDWKVDTDL